MITTVLQIIHVCLVQNLFVLFLGFLCIFYQQLGILYI